jgi:hypothetical protein
MSGVWFYALPATVMRRHGARELPARISVRFDTDYPKHEIISLREGLTAHLACLVIEAHVT